MDPLAILATIRAGFEFGAEALRFAQTEQGKALITKSLEDRAAWDKFWSDAGKGVQSLFKGDLFK